MSWKRPPSPLAAGAGCGFAEPLAKAARSPYGHSSADASSDDSGAIGKMAPPGTVGEHGVVQGVRAGVPHFTDADELDESVGNGVFVAEVERIVSIDKGNYRQILGLSPKEALQAKMIQTRYKHIMRIIHPDKRRALEVARAGGKLICDEAVILVQQALASARRPAVEASKPAPEDPEAVLRREAQQRIRKQQEVVRSQAQAAKMRGMAIEQAEQQRCTAQVSHLMQSIQKTLLIESLQQALVNKGEAAEIVSAPADKTTAQIMALLAQKNGGARCEPASDVVDLT